MPYLAAGKCPLILEAFEQERAARASRARLIGKEFQVIYHQGKVFNQFFNIPLTFHWSSSLHFIYLSRKAGSKYNAGIIFVCQGVLLLALSTANVKDHQETGRERTFILVILEEKYPGMKRKRVVNSQRKRQNLYRKPLHPPETSLCTL